MSRVSPFSQLISIMSDVMAGFFAVPVIQSYRLSSIGQWSKNFPVLVRQTEKSKNVPVVDHVNVIS